MDVVVRGRNVTVSPTLREAAIAKAARLARFGSRTTRAEIDFSEVRNRRVHDKQRCEVLVHVNGTRLHAEAAATEQQAALDLVLERVEQQARRLKEKRVARSHPRHPARARLLRGTARPVEIDVPAPDQASAREGRTIARVDGYAGKPMSPDEAADQLELLGLDFLFFASAETGRDAVLFRRAGGPLGLIDAGA